MNSLTNRHIISNQSFGRESSYFQVFHEFHCLGMVPKKPCLHVCCCVLWESFWTLQVLVAGTLAGAKAGPHTVIEDPYILPTDMVSLEKDIFCINRKLPETKYIYRHMM